jgi:hypothetical protein
MKRVARDTPLLLNPVVCKRTLDFALDQLSCGVRIYTEDARRAVSDVLFCAFVLTSAQNRRFGQAGIKLPSGRWAHDPVVDEGAMEALLKSVREKEIAFILDCQSKLEALVRGVMAAYVLKPMQLFVKLYDGRTATIWPLPSLTFWDLKVLIHRTQDTGDMPPQHMHLVWGGVVLNDRSAIMSVGLCSESTVHCTISMKAD